MQGEEWGDSLLYAQKDKGENIHAALEDERVRDQIEFLFLSIL